MCASSERNHQQLIDTRFTWCVAYCFTILYDRRCHLQVQEVGGIVERLLGFLEIDKPFVTAEALIQIADLLRRYPEMAEVSISSVSLISPQVWLPALACTQVITIWSLKKGGAQRIVHAKE